MNMNHDSNRQSNASASTWNRGYKAHVPPPKSAAKKGYYSVFTYDDRGIIIGERFVKE